MHKQLYQNSILTKTCWHTVKAEAICLLHFRACWCSAVFEEWPLSSTHKINLQHLRFSNLQNFLRYGAAFVAFRKSSLLKWIPLSLPHIWGLTGGADKVLAWDGETEKKSSKGRLTFLAWQLLASCRACLRTPLAALYIHWPFTHIVCHSSCCLCNTSVSRSCPPSVSLSFTQCECKRSVQPQSQAGRTTTNPQISLQG